MLACTRSPPSGGLTRVHIRDALRMWRCFYWKEPEKILRVKCYHTDSVWVLFLIVTPPLTASDFDSTQAERNCRDGDRGIDLITLSCSLLASAWSGALAAAPNRSVGGILVDWLVRPHRDGTCFGGTLAGSFATLVG